MKAAILAAIVLCLVGLGLVFVVFTSSRMAFVAPAQPAAGSGQQSANIGYGYGGNHKDPEQVRKANMRAELRLANWEDASPHHWRIAGWVLECTNIRQVNKLPVYLRDFFNPFNMNYEQGPALAPSERLPHHHEIALLQLSRAIGDHRVSLASKADETYGKAQWATWIVVILGFVTTIVVSFNSTELGKGEGKLPSTTRLLAIILTAMGTAISAIIAFYSPQAEWNDTKRMLSSLSELHNFIGLETWKLDCLEFQAENLKADSKGNMLVKQKFEEWTKRYHDLQTTLGSTNPSANAPGAGPANTPRSGGGAGGT
ncbi:MAG TPA: hypothetical protein VF915_22840 [Reyranella sp.]